MPFKNGSDAKKVLKAADESNTLTTKKAFETVKKQTQIAIGS